ncbi:MAG: FKBP-type peptidyl-prolyl cis-trans isomerase [Verrucomicrobia bacterium]|nr:FKBP-type peptidyl-prolyl cis-trans isomerase [Verrucomicrobiota bacterium]
MKLKWLAVLTIGLLALDGSAADKPVVKDEKEKISYHVGVEIAKNLKRQGIEVEMESVLRGLKDELSAQKSLANDEEHRAIISDFQVELRRKQALALKKASEENKKAGDAFLAENKAKKDVVTLPSGLQYKILKAGNGKIPTDTDAVKCHYRGTLVNGTEIDSSYKKGQPATHQMSRIIPGWKEALKLMPEGSKWQLVVPPQLAYGARGFANVGPNATLVFELELLSVEKPAPAPAAPKTAVVMPPGFSPVPGPKPGK